MAQGTHTHLPGVGANEQSCVMKSRLFPVCFSLRTAAMEDMMKRKTRSNLIMTLLIAVIAAAGVVAAFFLMEDRQAMQMGTLFSSADVTDESGEYTCTISIRCDTVLLNSDKLNAAKAPYVPEDGVVLAPVSVCFTPGETVFDVLRRVCEAGNIQLEYSWTPLYDSYYIEGISHLYEFDCGPESGWMYQVNGKFPNYGCSSYELQGGEEIAWCYTCAGLGTDVGAERME